jgi:hypothetical protein
MTRHVKDSDTHPFGHSIRKGSALHPSRTHKKTQHHRPYAPAQALTGPVARNVDMAVEKALRGYGKGHKKRKSPVGRGGGRFPAQRDPGARQGERRPGG